MSSGDTVNFIPKLQNRLFLKVEHDTNGDTCQTAQCTGSIVTILYVKVTDQIDIRILIQYTLRAGLILF
jgi:hypothetical protein